MALQVPAGASAGDEVQVSSGGETYAFKVCTRLSLVELHINCWTLREQSCRVKQRQEATEREKQTRSQSEADVVRQTL